MKQTITLWIRRQGSWAEYAVEIPYEAYVLDALEAAQRQDKTLLFRHSCHHASCGSCGMRVNGKERLACDTLISEIHRPGKPVLLEPLRNFPIIADLVIDPEHFLSQLDAVDMPLVGTENPENELGGVPRYSHFENCIECGLCYSACPVVGSDRYYLGPASIAAARRVLDNQTEKEASPVWELIDDEHGVWRCHGVFECTQVCPTGVDPAGGIMTLRQRLLRGRR